MTLGDVFAFLLPQWGDLLQLIFVLIMSAMVLLTMVSAYAIAKPASWEAKWNRGTPDDQSDDLDIEHGSVTDLWHAVATWPEKLAEIMPGMLLVVGLLGTFLGLGLALNHASQILGNPAALSAGGAASSMHELLGMLQGLGTKFKTSTWGIIGFVFLKIWSECTRFEEKRLTWVIGKVKTELESRKKHAEQMAFAKQAALFTRIEDAAGKIVGGVAEQLAKMMDQNRQLVTASAKLAQKQSDEVCQLLAASREHAGQNHLQLLEVLAADASARQDMAERQLQANTDATAQLRDSQQQGVTLLREQLETLGSQLQQTLFTEAEQDKQQHAELLAGMDTLHHDLQDVQQSAQATQQAMSSFTGSTEVLVKKMAGAAEGMAVGASEVGSAANSLVVAVDDFKDQFSEVLRGVREGLGSAIANMSSQASQTLETGSKQLAEATKEISEALAVLSGDVKATMTNVQTAIERAQELQRNGAVVFTSSIEGLDERMKTITDTIAMLTTPIADGLKTIGNVSGHLRILSKGIEDVVTRFSEMLEAQKQASPQIIELTQTLQKLPASNAAISDALYPLADMRKLLANIQQSLDGLQSIEILQPQLQKIVEQLSSISHAPERQQLLRQLVEQLSELHELKSVPDTLAQLASSLEPLRSFLADKGAVTDSDTVSAEQPDVATA
ncbi:hypothetical protein [Vogesella urethralis]|uniref:hypothetical protein n=1 Tax=Vogesella urethralis TaxID=2592656 RepID=UPI00118656A5|nr:hypothetical protein [Vogesella urethralis]